MVNVVAPLLITNSFLASLPPRRILITSSISHLYAGSHSEELDYQDLQMEKGFDAHVSYGLSKLLVLMFSRGLFIKGLIPSSTSLINMDPGTVNTKMLLAGWGPCGIPVD